MTRQHLIRTLFSILMSLLPCASLAQTISLFDGRTLNGWQTVDGEQITRGWEVVNGSIHLRAEPQRAGAIVTTRQFENYDLRFEWKIEPRGNSGIKYRVTDFDGRTLGCEYQILGPELTEATANKNGTGSLYDVIGPTDPIRLNPEGEFNRGRIIVLGNHIEHWLNGYRILSIEVGSDDWYRRKAKSKFSDVQGFGENQSGRIMLTDHGSETWYRKLSLTTLQAPMVLVNRTCAPTMPHPNHLGRCWPVRCRTTHHFSRCRQRRFWFRCR